MIGLPDTSTPRDREERPTLVGCIITLNEEHHIAAAVRSLLTATETVVVVDSLSGDATQEIARREGAIVLERSFDNFAAQRNWALDQINASLSPRWIFWLDADERLSPQLAHRVRAIAEETAPNHDAYLVPRRIRFCGRTLRHGGMASTQLPRLIRPFAGRYEARAVNEHFVLAEGRGIGALREELIHEDIISWSRYIAKHNRYSTLEAEARHRRPRRGTVTLRQAVFQQALRRRWIREHVWERLPAKPVVRFVQSYIVQLGFLDGAAGLNKAVFNAWLEMCIDLKYRELQGSSGAGCRGNDGCRL